MTNLQDFSIDIYKLNNKVYQYQYIIDDSFFALFERSTVDQGKLDVKVILDKQETLITARFLIDGSVTLICDRSLETFDYPLHIEESLLYQYGEEEEELTDEIMIITSRTQQINVAQPIYEFIALAVPMKRLHPKYANDDHPYLEGEIVFSSQQDDVIDTSTETTVDPRWEALKKLKKE